MSGPACSLVFIEVFAGDVVLGDFVSVDFTFVGVASVLDALHDLSLEGVPFLEQFVDALRVRALPAG